MDQSRTRRTSPVQGVHFVHDVHFLRTGTHGPQGDPGAPGEVSNADLTTAIGGTSANTNAINRLGLTVSDPPTQTELQAVANKLDELIAALRR